MFPIEATEELQNSCAERVIREHLASTNVLYRGIEEFRKEIVFPSSSTVEEYIDEASLFSFNYSIIKWYMTLKLKKNLDG